MGAQATMIISRKIYFASVSALLLLLSVVAFSDNLFYDIHQESNSDPKFVIHGLFFLAWYIMLVVQSNFIRKGDVRAHKRLGIWGMAIGAGVVISTFYVFAAIFEGIDKMPFYVKANRILTTTFAIFLVLSYVNRHRPEKHKRFLYVGTLCVMGPVLDRVSGVLQMEGLLRIAVFEMIIWNIFFFSLFYYDKLHLGKIHPISLYGFIWFYAVWSLAFFVL